LKDGTIVNLRYVGNHSNNLLRQIDLNQINFNAQGFFADFQRAQNNLRLSGGTSGAYNSAISGSQPLTVFPLLANGGSLTNATNITYLTQGQVATMADSYMTGRTNGSVNFYPNQNIQSAFELVNGGYGNYNGVQAEVTKRTRSGFQMQFSYSFSKALSNTTGDQQAGIEPLLDNNNPSLEYARSPFDNTHAFKANYYYELPFGAGKKWHGNRIVNTAFGGWAVSGIWLYQSGSPYSILSGYGTFNRGARSTSTNTASVNGTTKDTLDPLTSGVFMTGTGPYFVSPSLIGADGRGASAPGTQPFAGQVFYNPNAGTVGNLQRRMFNSPWQWKWDASVKKEFRFGERQTLNLHFDFFNWANHPTFYIYPSTSGDYGSVTNQTINSVNFGKITDMNYSSRILQFGAYYRF